MMRASFPVIALLFCVVLQANAQSGFYILPLGTSGGVDEGSMSGYAIATKPSDGSMPSEWVLFESGSFVNGLRIASSYGVLRDLGVPHKTLQCQNTTVNLCLDWAYFMNVMIKGYFVTHPHLDHFSGLVIASASDSTGPMKTNQKKIYGLPFTTDSISRYIFNWISWPNMLTVTYPGNIAVNLNTYAPYPMTETVEVTNVAANLHATPYMLAHGTAGSSLYNSTAFFFRSGAASVAGTDRVFIGFGDTGADSQESSTHMNAVWQAAAPLWINGKLLGILIEVSYDNSKTAPFFGHVTPTLLTEELTKFATIVNASSPIGIAGLNVIVTHVKTSLFIDDPESLILSQLNAINTNRVQYIMPHQARTITLKPDRTYDMATLPNRCASSSTGSSSSGIVLASSSSSSTGSGSGNVAGRSTSVSMMFTGFVALLSTLFVGLRLSF